MSRPSNMMRPAVGVSMRSTASPVVDLPQPLSPTSPSVSPRFSAKLTPSTALMVPTRRLMTAPLSSGKCTLRFSTLRISSAFAGAAGVVRAPAAPLSSDVIEAGPAVVVGDAYERRTAHAARVSGDPAAGRERATEWKLRQVWRLAFDGHKRSGCVAVEARDGGHQSNRV